MGIGSVTSMNSMSGMQMLKAASTDPKIKKIENEIASAKQQMQKLSPTNELSDNDNKKEIERKKLQREISSLNTELKQHQDELRKSQKKEIRMAELRENQKLPEEGKAEDKIQTKEASPDKAAEKDPSDERQQAGSPGTVIFSNSDGTVILKDKMNPDAIYKADTEEKQDEESKEKETVEKDAGTSLSPNKIYAIVSAGSSIQQASRQGTIISSTRDGIAVLKGEMNQDELRGTDTEKKQDELKKMEKKEQRAIAFQSSVLGQAINTMKSTAQKNVTGIKDKAQINAQNNAFINAIKVSQEETQAAQQKFYVSFG